jgi:hypothetical protein
MGFCYFLRGGRVSIRVRVGVTRRRLEVDIFAISSLLEQVRGFIKLCDIFLHDCAYPSTCSFGVGRISTVALTRSSTSILMTWNVRWKSKPEAHLHHAAKLSYKCFSEMGWVR